MNIEVDGQFEESLEKLKNFDKDADFELIRAIDRRIMSSSVMKLANYKESQFNVNDLALATNSKVKSMDSDLV